jgi:hypothetical protein
LRIQLTHGHQEIRPLLLPLGLLDELRGGMDASQYKDYVLFMLFTKYITDKYGDSSDFAPPVTIPKAMRRRVCDPLAETHRPHWLTVSDMYQNLVACEALPVGADLRRALTATLMQCEAGGWQAESGGAYGFTFIARGLERRLVNLTPADPAARTGQGHAFLAGRGALNAAE